MKRSPISAFVLLILGVIFLLNNFGYLSWDLWNNVWRFWPIMLILISLELIFTKKGSGQLLVIAAIIIFGVPFLLQGQKLPFNFNFNFLPKNIAYGSVGIDQKLGTLIEGKMAIELTNGSLKIDSLNKQSTQFVTGDLKYSKINKEPQVVFTPQDSTGYLTISNNKTNLPVDLSANEWNLKLSRLVPFIISVSAKNSQGDINLEALTIKEIKLDLGKTNSNIVAPTNSTTNIEITATEGTINLTIAAKTPALIKLSGGEDSSISDRFEKTQDGYQSGDYDQASTKLTVTINPGKAKVSVL